MSVASNIDPIKIINKKIEGILLTPGPQGPEGPPGPQGNPGIVPNKIHGGTPSTVFKDE